MNSYITALTVLAAVTSAHIIPRHHHLPNHSAEHYAKSAELYQSGLEQQHGGSYGDQSQGFAGDVGHRSSEGGARVLSHQVENDGHGYAYSYETENGIKAQEQGTYQGKSFAVQGGYSYKGDDGQTYTVTYTADENGFRPSGAHIPTPPPIPEGVLKGMEQNAKDEAAGIYDDGSYKESHQHQGQTLPENNYQPTYENYHQQSESSHHQQPTFNHQSHATSYQAPITSHHNQLPGYLSHTNAEFGQTTQDFGHQSHSYQSTGYQGSGYQGLVTGYQSLGNSYGHDAGLGQGATVQVSSSSGGVGYHYRH